MASKYTEHVIKFINAFWKKHNYSPSIRDIKDHLDTLPVSGGNVSTSNIAYVLENELGYPRKKAGEKGLARQIVPNWVKNAIKEAKVE